MTPHSLSPGFIRLDYHSAYGAHVALLPTKEWFPTSIGGTMGSYEGWGGIPLDAEQMVNNLVDTLAVQHGPTTAFDLATVFTQALPVGPAIPRASAALTQVGSNGIGGPDKATQLTLNGRSADFHPWKLVMLDVPVGTSNFNKVLPSAFTGTMLAIMAEYGNLANAWAARDDSQPSFSISATITLNERLRQEYRMA